MARFLLIGGLASSLIRFRGPLIEAAIRAGHTVDCAAGDDDPRTSAALHERGVRFHPIDLERAGSNPLADLRALRDIAALLRRVRPDVMLGYTIKPALYGVLAARCTGIGRPFAMLSGLGHALTTGAPRGISSMAARALARLALPKAERVFFHNDGDRHSCEARGLLPPGHGIVVSGSGVDLRAFPAAPLAEGPPTFLLVARLLRDKGIGEFVEAARRVQAEHPHAQFRVVGGRDENPRSVTAGEVEAWRSTSPVQFVGPVQDPYDEYARCHAFVLPSYYPEGLPRTLLEAMAVGRAVVTTDMPGCRDAIADANGLLVPPQDAVALSRAMCTLIEDRQRLRDMGARGRRLAETRFDARVVARHMLDAMGLQGSSTVPHPRATREAA
jgi:glycosyltransferase involved in cell wall biosynthesis